MVGPEEGTVSDLYFLEKMTIGRRREVERQAEFRTRLGLHHRRAEATPCRVRRLVGGWLIRAGVFLLQANPDPEAVIGQIMGGAMGGAVRRGGQNG